MARPSHGDYDNDYDILLDNYIMIMSQVQVVTFLEMYRHVCTMYITCMYDRIVHTRHIHGTDISVHVYTRRAGFQIFDLARGWALT